MRTFSVGDRVRFARDYSLGMPAELQNETPDVASGTVGEVVACHEDKLWVRVSGIREPVTVWFPEFMSHEPATTLVLEKA
jgi:hypothetical protein